MILTHGWDGLDDIWKHRAKKLLDEERIEELVQSHASGGLAPGQTAMEQISVFAEDTLSAPTEDEPYSA